MACSITNAITSLKDYNWTRHAITAWGMPYLHEAKSSAVMACHIYSCHMYFYLVFLQFIKKKIESYEVETKNSERVVTTKTRNARACKPKSYILFSFYSVLLIFVQFEFNSSSSSVGFSSSSRKSFLVIALILLSVLKLSLNCMLLLKCINL